MPGALKDIGGGGEKPCIYRKKHPPPTAVSVTEDTLKAFSNDFLSIIWIFKSQCPHSNSPGRKTSQGHTTDQTAKAEER